MKTTLKLGVAALAAAGCLMTTTYAAAQQAEGEVGMALPGAQPGTAAAAQGESDHDAMIGRIAVGYMGAYQIPISAGGTFAPPLASISQGSVTAPAIGLRYWLDQMIGLDIGVGFSNTSGSTKGESGGASGEAEDPAVTGFLLHGGLPLSLASAGHFSFQLVPELNVGFATSTFESGATTDDRTGLLFELGARVGGEIHFGFIGIPELSLQAGVGAHFATRQWKSVIKTAGNPDVTITRTETVVETTLNNNPWDIFTGNISALYYF
jgi:hypothetical protein